MAKTKEVSIVHRGSNGVGASGPYVTSKGVTAQLVKMDFWGELSKDEQKTVLTETDGILKDMENIRQLRMTVARRGLRVQAVLAPRGAYGKYLHTLAQHWRSVYRWVDRLKQLNLPEPVLDAAEERGIDLIHLSYVETVKALPAPPPGITEDQADKYVDRIAQERARMAQERLEGGGRSITPIEAERRAFRAVVTQWQAVAGRGRVEWSRRLLGRLLAVMGMPAQRIEPEAPPAEWQRGSGRPKLAE